MRGGGVVFRDKGGGVDVMYGGGDVVDVAMDVEVVCWRMSLEYREDGSSCVRVGGV